jgi:RNA recognition motif-containing protein
VINVEFIGNEPEELYIGNLSSEITVEELMEIFKPYGEVCSLSVNDFLFIIQIINAWIANFDEHSLGYGFVHMKDRATAQRALDELNEVCEVIILEIKIYDYRLFGMIEKLTYNLRRTVSVFSFFFFL